MEYEVFWDNEVVADNDEAIALLEAQITMEKAILSRLAEDDEDLGF